VNGVCFLTDVKERRKMRIVAHTGREEIARRLTDMGLSQGMECEILIPGENHSPYLIAVNESRLALEDEIAKNLRVELLDGCRHRHRRGKRRMKRHATGWFASGK